jgi:putative ABC transport system permease protein
VAPGPEGREAAVALRTEGWVSVPQPSVIDNLRQAGPVPALLGGFLVVLGSAGLVHATWLLLSRRRKDLAIARSIGFDTRGVQSSVRWNASLLVLAGLAIGVPVGLVAGRMAWLGIADRLGVVGEIELQWWLPLTVVVVLVALGLAVAEPLARRATRRLPAEVLRSE